MGRLGQLRSRNLSPDTLLGELSATAHYMLEKDSSTNSISLLVLF